MQPTEFLLAVDLQTPNSGPYILRVKQPVALISVRNLSKEDPVVDNYFDHTHVTDEYKYRGTTYQLVAMPLKDVSQFVLSPGTELYNILEKAWEWYVSTVLNKDSPTILAIH